jgi:hypothetical protein
MLKLKLKLNLKLKSPKKATDTAKLTFELVNNQLELTNKVGVDVHDHNVQESLKKSFSNLSAWYKKNIREPLHLKEILKVPLKELKTSIFSCKDISVVEKAYTTLKTMEKYNEFIVSLNVHELDVLYVVLERINCKDNFKNRDNLFKSLIYQLADSAKTLDETRCASGRVARIIQSLEGIDDIVKISSTENIRKELSDKVPHLIKKYLKENITSPCELQRLIGDELKLEYKDLLSNNEFSYVIKEYLEAIE